MKNYGFVRVAVATPLISVADCVKNAQTIVSLMTEAERSDTSLIVFPELCISGCTCGDLFLQHTLQDAVLNALQYITSFSEKMNLISIVGLPFLHRNSLYNIAAVIQSGTILAFIPKTHIPNYGDLYEKRYFTSGSSDIEEIYVPFQSQSIPFGTSILIEDICNKMNAFAVEIGDDVSAPISPSIYHASQGAAIIANLSASNEIIGKADYRRIIIKAQSARLACAYLYANAGSGESTTDAVFAAHNLIAENGTILSESELFAAGITYADIDIQRISYERFKNTSFFADSHLLKSNTYIRISVPFQYPDYDLPKTILLRSIVPNPFVPEDEKERFNRCREVLELQSRGLQKRLQHTGVTQVVLGLSGGLDSTLALLVIIHTFDRLKLERSGIHAVTMPCFGTTDRTYANVLKLSRLLGIHLQEISIQKSVLQHFEDIGHNPAELSLVYENAQARERTQILMDIANKYNVPVIGTGDLSELALGWATYNGDHMSMYGVNASVPKTLVRHIVQYYADIQKNIDSDLSDVLYDIIDTPVSPELLPAEDGCISQKTEHIVGPYVLHDFFLYYFIRWGFTPQKIAFLAETAGYAKNDIEKWLVVFLKRFFSQQFKRSCLPDGAKVGSVSLSPRTDWRMPSDADSHVWLEDLER